MAPHAEVNRDFVGNRSKMEAGSGKLTKIDPTFYQDVERYMRRLQEDFQTEQTANPGSAKSALLLDDISSTRAHAEDIFERRERKIVSAALSAARGATPDTTNMLAREREFFEALVALLRDGKRSILRSEPLQGRAATAGRETAHTITQPAAPAEGRPPAIGPSPAAAPGPAAPPPPIQPASPALTGGIDNRVVVRVLADVPAFKASDMRTYKLTKEDVVSLPRDAARALSMRGLVQFITGAVAGTPL